MSEVPRDSYFIRDEATEEDQGLNWPPYLCPHCWAMRFYYNTFMAQCYYCSHIILRRTHGTTELDLGRPGRDLADNS